MCLNDICTDEELYSSPKNKMSVLFFSLNDYLQFKYKVEKLICA